MNLSRSFLSLQNGNNFEMPAKEMDVLLNVIHLLFSFAVRIALFYRFADRNKVTNGPS